MQRNVLLVEDNPHDFDKFDDLLKQLGCRAIRKANNYPLASYDDAIKVLQSGTPVEYAILDINLLGEKTGVDIAQYILINRLPIKIVFTTSFLDDLSIAERIAYIGTQYGTITKNNSVIDKRATLFILSQMLNSVNPLLPEQIDYVWIRAKKVNPNHNIKQQLSGDELKYQTHRVEKNAITYALVGEKNDIKGLPRNKAILLTNQIKEAYLTDLNLTQLKDNGTLSHQFVQINSNVIINLKYYEYVSKKEKKKQTIVVLGNEFEVTSKYRSGFHAALVSYKLVPLSSK